MSTEHESELPRDPEYWERLADRVIDDAAGPLAGYAGLRADEATVVDWYRLLARRAPWLVAASAVVAAALWLALPARDSVAIAWIQHSVTPSDGAGTLVGGTSPPAVNELLVRFSAPLDEEERR